MSTALATRAQRVPPDAVSVRPDGTDLEVFVFADHRAKLCAVAFAGKAAKPVWRYAFRDAAHRERFIAEQAERRRKFVAEKATRVAERKAFRHSLTVDAILVSSWGYDQTNIDFYQVVGVAAAHTVTVCKIAQAAVANGGGEDDPRDRVVPTVGVFVGEALTRRVAPGNVIAIEDYAHAYPWDGNPKYQTAAGWGH